MMNPQGQIVRKARNQTQKKGHQTYKGKIGIVIVALVIYGASAENIIESNLATHQQSLKDISLAAGVIVAEQGRIPIKALVNLTYVRSTT